MVKWESKDIDSLNFAPVADLGQASFLLIPQNSKTSALYQFRILRVSRLPAPPMGAESFAFTPPLKVVAVN